MQIVVSDDVFEVRLAVWERVVGLMRSLRIPRASITDVELVEDPMREAMRAGLKIGLRLPWVRYVARTVRLDQVLIVRRRLPGLSISVAGEGPLRRVLLSTPEAADLADRLRPAASSGL